jgi:hypothetical protein
MRGAMPLGLPNPMTLLVTWLIQPPLKPWKQFSKPIAFQVPPTPLQSIHHFPELLDDNVLLDEELVVYLVIAFVMNKVGIDAPVVKAFGSFQEGVICGVKAYEHLDHPIGEGFDRWVSVVWLCIDRCDIGCFIGFPFSQHLHLPISMFPNPYGDHLISSTGGDGVDDISLIVYIPLWDGDVFSFLVADLAHKTCNQLS